MYYFALQVILPLVRSYGDNSMVTLSPGSILIKFILSFPEIWAKTLWPFSISTWNIAFGNASITVHSTSITSSFAKLAPPPELFNQISQDIQSIGSYLLINFLFFNWYHSLTAKASFTSASAFLISAFVIFMPELSFCDIDSIIVAVMFKCLIFFLLGF